MRKEARNFYRVMCPRDRLPYKVFMQVSVDGDNVKVCPQEACEQACGGEPCRTCQQRLVSFLENAPQHSPEETISPIKFA